MQNGIVVADLVVLALQESVGSHSPVEAIGEIRRLKDIWKG